MAPFSPAGKSLDELASREWLATNGIGGFASSSVPLLNTRKYHGLLVAAMLPPVRRMVLLARMEETVSVDGWAAKLDVNEYPGTVFPQGHQLLAAFSHEPFPRWAYQGHGWTIEKGLRLLRGENTVLITYTLLHGDKPVTLELRPLFALRGIHELSYQWNGRLDTETRSKRHHRIPPTSRTPEVFFAHDDGTFQNQGYWYLNAIHRREQERGYGGLEDLWSPGAVRATLSPGGCVRFVCSAEPIDMTRVLRDADRELSLAPSVGTPGEGWGEGDLGLRVTLNSKSPSPPPSPGVPTEGVAARDHEHVDALVRAASQFVARVPGDVGGTESGTALVTDFPWAAPSVRNALIALPGILLVAGRFAEVRSFLRSLYAKIDRGLVPSEFPESGAAPLYKACDTSLWWVHAVQQYLRYSGDADASLRPWLDAIDVIIESHHHGSAPGMTCDEDALLASRVPGCGTTWMDAKVGDWVVTPRASRPVELNALWYNALRFGAELHGRRGDALRAKEYADLAARVRESFNRRFWNDAEACCYDVVDDHGPDPSVRPNQLLAISLPFPVLDAARHAAVLDKVTRDLLTPRGVRTLSPHDPSYQGRYAGNVVSRDRAYHQGTAYPWLLGPLVSATLRVLGRGEKARQQARQLLAPCLRHLHEDGLGQLPELFDGDPPHRPGGATASARSVGELLRALVEEVFDQAPRPGSPAGGTLVDIVTVARPVPASPKP